MAASGRRARVTVAEIGAGELIRLDIPALPAFVGVARVVVASVATTVDGIDDDRLEDLRIAVSEVCTNAVEATLADGADPRVILRCVLAGDALEVHIEDGVARHGSHAATSTAAGVDGAERGWGLQLVRALVDDVSFADGGGGGGGSSVRLVVQRSVTG